MLPTQEISQARPGPWLQGWGRLECSFDDRQKIWAAALLAAGLAIRIWHSSGTFLNADEAMHFAAANQPSWWLTYKASLSLAHPPLLIFVLHLWRHLGTSELMLRTPSILAGTAFCWFAFRWMLLLFESAVAWAGFCFLIFLPSSIQLSSEVRQYAIFLLFATASAYFLEVALAERSASRMLLSGACLWLAILSHFSAFLFAAALGIYAVLRMIFLRMIVSRTIGLRIIENRFGLRIFAAWEFGQVIAIALGYFLYVTQIVGLEQAYRGFSVTSGFSPDGFLAKYYFVRGSENALAFTLARTGGFFQFVFRQLAVGDIAAVLFLVGICALLLRREPARINRYLLAALLLLPFAMNCVAALLRLYPYGGTRHSAFLLPFAIAGVSVAVALICGNRRASALLFAGAISVLCVAFPSRQFAESSGQNKENMNAALGFIRQLPPSETIFADVQSSLLLRHYLCDQRALATDESHPGFMSYECGGHKVVVAGHRYVFNIQTFSADAQELVREYKLGANRTICVAEIGLNTHLESELKSNWAGFASHHFGNEISMFEMNPGEAQPEK